ncbi:YceI family protein [Actinoplanes sp. TRM 88003]|uniref:YceI family protein n=1 Tax=Paractinoplanes aksuensis TaxID=2939490 RepID=A0ABT1DL20_9ACTN|nr:YceI family protein [Actinoplanes aksuensis]MCO8270446.1 YceI family protein [Actinoplanes aksuensis]
MVDRPIREWNGLTIPDAGVYKLDDAHKRLGFLAQHMMVSPVRGEFARGNATIFVAEDPMRSTVTATIDTTSLTTHNADRDTHLSSADFLDVERYPVITFRSTGVQWQQNNDEIFLWARLRNNPLSRRPNAASLPAARPSGKFVVNGLLTIRDVTRPIDLNVEYGGARRDPYDRDIFGFSATADFEREDFGLVWNVLLESGGFLVGKSVRIEIAGEAILETAG